MPGEIAVRYLEANQLSIWRPEGSWHLRVEIVDDRVVLDAQIRRVFPLSNPTEYFSLQDGLGKEVGVLRGTDGLDARSRELLDEEIDRRYFTPLISRIDKLKQDAGMWKFSVQTQRGATEFYVRNWRDSAHEIEAGRWLVWSVDGQRFEIPRMDTMDERSVALLEQLL
jgi:hypothetical protein